METSDLVYKDNDSSLTRFLIAKGYLDVGIWAGAKPEYYIEVKTTTGKYNDRFFMNGKQYTMVCSCIFITLLYVMVTYVHWLTYFA